jgi:peptide/nickel transport system permease protein
MTETLIEQDVAAADADRDVRGASSFWRYAARKVGGACVSIVMVVVLGFFAFRVLPGDPVRSMTRGRIMSPEQLATLKRQFGLDQSLLAQFWIYLRDLPRGELGTSYVYRRPVSELIAEHVGATLLLTGVALTIAVTLGLWIGPRSAWQRGTWFDRVNTGTALVLWSVPTFWLGLILLLVFGGTLHWLPTGGLKTAGTTATGLPLVLDVARHLVMPVVTLVAVTYAQYLLVMRASLLEEMHADYLVTARAKGLREDLVRRRHAVPNALLPTVTLVFLHVGTLIAGAVTTEAVFSWPGLGYLTYAALSGPDLPLLQGTFVVFSGIVIVMNLLADLVYRFLDPRVRSA